MGSFMRHLLLVIVCMLPGLAGPADHFNLARILVTGSQRYREDDLVRATGLTVNTQVTSTDLQNGSPVDALQLDRDLAQVRKLYGQFGREAVIIKPVPAFVDDAVSFTAWASWKLRAWNLNRSTNWSRCGSWPKATYMMPLRSSSSLPTRWSRFPAQVGLEGV
jgi:hypothetical protein